MSSYRGTADRPDRARAIAAVVIVHAALAFVILSGLNVRMVSRAVEHITTIRIKEAVSAPPRPVERARPQSRPRPARRPQGKEGRKADPAPLVERKLKPFPSPVTAAKVPGSGSAASSGSELAGTGSGSGSSGAGSSGAGYADYSRFSPARLVENIPNSEYRQLASTGIPSGLVGVIILVNANGTVSNCRIARSSGDPSVDSLVCQLTLRYVRFEPARDPYGRPVPQDITYFPNWRRR